MCSSTSHCARRNSDDKAKTEHTDRYFISRLLGEGSDEFVNHCNLSEITTIVL
jgi:hypothetical protein